MNKSFTYILALCISSSFWACNSEDSSSSDQEMTAGTEEIVAGDEEAIAGTEQVTAGSEEASAGAEEVTAGNEEVTAGTEEVIAGVEVEMEMMPNESQLPPGLEDDFSRQACDLLNGEGTELIAVSSQSEAGQITLLPSGETAYRIKLSETGVSYLTLEVPDWSVTVGIFTHHTQEAKIITSVQDTEVVGPLSANASCREYTDERVHFHSWGSYVIELRGEPNSELKLAMIKRQ